MNIQINPETRIFILEGIAGAGKNTLQAELKKHFAGNVIWDFPEEELLFNWKHMWLKDLERERLSLYHKVLDHAEDMLAKDPDSIFLLNRFHISLKIFGVYSEPEMLASYDRLLERLKALPVSTIIPVMDDSLIESRSIHKERLDPIWKMYLERKLKLFGCSDLVELYSKEQKRILALAETQGIPYQTLTVDVNVA